MLYAFPKVEHSAKFVQTTRVVCTDFSRSLYRLQLKSADLQMHTLFSSIIRSNSQQLKL